jgi:hypothetical protein
MELVTDIVDLGALTVAAREIESPADYVGEQLLPVREIQDVEYLIQRGTITRGVAQYRAFDAETPIGKRKATATKTRQELLPLGQKLVIGEYERILLQRAQGAANGSLVTTVYDDTRSNVQAIRARVQRAIGQVLSTGTFVLQDENGLYDVADFDVPDSHLDIAPDALFSDVDADLFGFLEELAVLMQTDSDDGQVPGQYVTSRRVMNAIRRNKQVIRGQWGPLATEGQVTPAQVNAILTEEGLPPIRVVETKVGGQRIFPDHKFIALPSNPSDLGRTVYGITVEALELVGSKAVDFSLKDAPGITAVTMKQGDPPAIWSKATATCLPVLERPELLLVANVLAPQS